MELATLSTLTTGVLDEDLGDGVESMLPWQQHILKPTLTTTSFDKCLE